MAEIHAGAALDRPPDADYCKRLGFAELAVRPPLPKVKTLASVRQKLPSGFRLALTAPRAAVESARGPLRFDTELDASFSWMVDAARALATDFLVIPTSSGVTTSRRDRDLLTHYFVRCVQEGAGTVVWVPTGLWEPEQAAEFASELGILYGYDPRVSTAPEGDVLYARVRAAGGYHRLSDSMLERVSEVVSETEARDAYVVLESNRAMRDAVRLTELSRAREKDEASEEAHVADDGE